MSRVRTNLVKPFNAASLTVENPSLTGTVVVQGKQLDISDATNGQALVYDGSQQKFRAQTVSFGGGDVRLTQLTDVIVATDSEGNCVEPDDSILVFNNDPNNALDGFWSATRTLDGGGYDA